MTLPQLKKSLETDRQAIPVYMPKELHRKLVILSQELGMSMSEEIVEAVRVFLNRPLNRKLLKQTSYVEINEVEKVFI